MESRYAIAFRRRQEERRAVCRALSRRLAERLREAAAEAAALYPAIRRVTVFGSVARERATERSDVDVLVEGSPAGEYYELRRLLSELLEREVDLHTDTEPAAFVERVRAQGKCVYERRC